MVYAGARGETETQIANILHVLPQDEHHIAFNALAQHLEGLNKSNLNATDTSGYVQLHNVNTVRGQQNTPFQKTYLVALAQQYGACLRVIDFKQQLEAARNTINARVAEQTAKPMEELLPEVMLTSGTRFIVVNAIYFKATWLFPCDKSVPKDRPFTLLNGSTVSVSLMHQTSALYYRYRVSGAPTILCRTDS